MIIKYAENGRFAGVIGAQWSAQEAIEVNKVYEAIATRTPFVFAAELNREQLAVFLAKVAGELVDDSRSGNLQNRKEVVLDAPALHASELTVTGKAKSATLAALDQDGKSRDCYLLPVDFFEQIDGAIKIIYASQRRQEESMTVLLQSLHSRQQ